MYKNHSGIRLHLTSASLDITVSRNPFNMLKSIEREAYNWTVNLLLIFNCTLKII